MLNTIFKGLKMIANWLFQTWKSLALFIGSWILIILIVIIVATVSFSGKIDDSTQLGLSRKVVNSGSDQEVALVRLSGEITSSSSENIWEFNPYSITPSNIRSLTSKLSELEKIKAVILVINSPGGSVAASEEIYQQIKILSEIKPVYAYFEETAASGGYYIALPAKKIFASIPTITGSIGVIAYDLDISELMEKTGVKLDTHQSGLLKDFGSYTRSSTAQEIEIFNSIIDDSYQLFITRIEENRNLDRDEILKLADGRIYSASQAKENGLIDELGTVHEAIKYVSDDMKISQPTVVEYSLDSGFWSGFLGVSVRNFIPSSAFPAQLLNQKAGVYFL